MSDVDAKVGHLRRMDLVLQWWINDFAEHDRVIEAVHGVRDAIARRVTQLQRAERVEATLSLKDEAPRERTSQLALLEVMDTLKQLILRVEALEAGGLEPAVSETKSRLSGRRKRQVRA